MKKPILVLLCLVFGISIATSQNNCNIEGQGIACKGEKVIVQYTTDAEYTDIKIDAFTVFGGTQELAIVENITGNSAEIIFVEGGDAEIVVRFLDGSDLTSICNLNVFVLDDEPIGALGKLSNMVEDQITCEAIDLDFEMFIICPDCPFYWTLNDEVIEIEQSVAVDSVLQLINGNISIEGVGSYEFCHHILKQDSTCSVTDCINIDIIEITDLPDFSLDENESIFCMGSTLHFENETEVDEDVHYIWEVNFDTLTWKYTSEHLDFDFIFPGSYTIDLQYSIVGDPNCISDKATMQVDITDAPIIPITCSSNSCQDSIYTFSTPIDCAGYEWIIDESLGEIVSEEDNSITIRWNEVDFYTETKISLFLDGCEEDACNETFRDIVLFPEHVAIEGPRGICDRGTEWYEAALIPGAIYTWEIEVIDSVSGISPEITKIEDNRARIAFYSFVGKLAIKVNASLPSRDCAASGEIFATSLFIHTNDDLCPGSLFKASVLPNIEEEVVWTLTNEDLGYFNEQTLPGEDDFFAFDLNEPGTYSLNVGVPELGFECGDAIPLTILDPPAVNLLGPTYVCPGDNATYTLSGLGGNDEVEWTVFQNNTSTEYIGNEITIDWIEGGQPYVIKVKRTTEVTPGQFCDSDYFVFDIQDPEELTFEINGPEVLCYDAIDTFTVTGFPGQYIWNIVPEYMGTIVHGDSTAQVVIQWHYAPDIAFATLSMSREICGSTISSELDVYFEPYVPILSAPDSICHGEFGMIELLELETFQTIDIFVDGELVDENKLSHSYLFRDTGWVEIKVDVVHPNDCPSVASITRMVYVIPILQFGLSTDMPIAQCPKENFQTVIAEVDYQDEESYYVWSIDGVVINEGLGNEDIYTFTITKEMIDSEAGILSLQITPPDECPSSKILALDYTCEMIRCECIEDVVGQVDYVTPLECNLVNFGGSLDFSTIDNPYWNISLPDTLIIIPINGPEDLIQDSFYFDESSTVAQVAIRGMCDGVLVNQDNEVLDTATCDFVLDELSSDLYAPDFVREYFCNEDLTYDIVLTEKRLRNSSPPYSSMVKWVINGEEYDGISIRLENVEGSTPLNITMTQCSLDSSYCCTRSYETTVRKKFEPEIILPEGSCENDIWAFTIDQDENFIESTLWDFGDGSGSTLFLTEKGFPDNLPHTVSVVVTDLLGCVDTTDITVQSFPNEIDGFIDASSDPCAPSVLLNYVENSASTIVEYNWDINNPMDTSTVEVFNSGSYSVTVTDNHGCTGVSSIDDITVNESFSNGIRFDEENCGTARVSLFANPAYTYSWYVDGIFVNEGSSVNIVTPGEHEVKVTSTSIETNEICDSIVESLFIFPNPESPLIEKERVFCDPFIVELTITNYETALWLSSLDVPQDGKSIQVAQNGNYSAIIEDENGCQATTTSVVNVREISFDQYLDQCIMACREDLDSLNLTIPGLGEFFTDWTWISVDSFGVEYEVSASSGLVTPLVITADMYEYVQLMVHVDGCDLRSERIPLDIEDCKQPDPPVEIECEEIDSDHASCGQSIYKCLLSEENGGPKLYFEGSVTLPMDAVLCSEDTLSVSLSNGDIAITDLLFEEADGKIMAYYSANMVIEDVEDYNENGTTITFDFCNEEGEIAYCYEYTLPYRSCNKDFSCLIDYQGISAGGPGTVDVNYCLNLSEVVQEDCTLSQYEIRVILSGDIEVKTIHTEILSGGFDDLHCISIPITEEDFFGGGFDCIELMVDGDCPGIKCSKYQCGILGNSYLKTQAGSIERFVLDDEHKAVTEATIEDEEKEEALEIFPNPSTGTFTVDLTSTTPQDRLLIRDIEGKKVREIGIGLQKRYSLDLSTYPPGMYSASWIREGRTICSKILILIE